MHVVLADLGLSGPRSTWHLEPLPALAASGALYASGFPELPPCNAPGHLAHDCASVYGAIGAVAAVLDRERRDDGGGQLVEVSVQEAALAGTTPWSIAMEDYLKINPRLPAEGTRNAEGAYWVLPASDGWIRAVIGSQRQWGGFVALLRNPDALLGDEWQNPGFRLANADVIRLVAEARLTDRTRAQLFEEALSLGTTIGVLHRASEFVAHPQTTAHHYFVDAAVPGLDGLPFATHPVTFSRTPGRARLLRARRPTAGSANAGVLPDRPSVVTGTCCSTGSGWSSSASPPWSPSCAVCSPNSVPTSSRSSRSPIPTCCAWGAATWS